MATKEKRGKKTEPRYPEKKWRPFAGLILNNNNGTAYVLRVAESK